MTRTFLCSAIEGLATKCGYTFHLADKAYYPATVCRYPAAFMFLPEFVRIEGRKQGRITHNVTLRFARQGAKLSAAERNALLEEMESEIVDLFIALSSDKTVAVVENLTIAPIAEALDLHGAVALEANADITTIF